MARKIVITSGKGGAGKTTIAVLLAKRLAKLGKRTLVIDLDSSLNNLDVLSGVEDRVEFYLEDAVSGKCRARQTLVPVEKNFSIIESMRSEKSYSPPQSVKLLADGFSDVFDFILFDCPAGIDASFHRAVACADEALVVINCYPTSLRDCDKVVNILKSYKLKSVVCVANRVRRDLISKGKSISEGECEEILKVPVIASVPESDDVLCFCGDLPLLSPCAAAIKKLAKKITNKDYVSSADIFKTRKRA